MARYKKYSWASSDGLQERILDTALAVFREHGFSDSTMAHIVDAGDVSIGSIYHHFGGKDELFTACYSRLRATLRASIGLEPGDDMPPQEWEAKYLWAVWENREACSVFLVWDGPAGFHPGAGILECYADISVLTGRMLCAIMLEAMRIITEDGADDVGRIIDGTVNLLGVVRAEEF